MDRKMFKTTIAARTKNNEEDLETNASTMNSSLQNIPKGGDPTIASDDAVTRTPRGLFCLPAPFSFSRSALSNSLLPPTPVSMKKLAFTSPWFQIWKVTATKPSTEKVESAASM